MTLESAQAWAILVASIAAAVVSIIVALRQNGAVANVREVREAVRTSNGSTVGEILERNDLAGGHDAG